MPGPTARAGPGRFFQNWNWWLDNGAALVERFEEWLLAADATPDAAG